MHGRLRLSAGPFPDLTSTKPCPLSPNCFKTIWWWALKWTPGSFWSPCPVMFSVWKLASSTFKITCYLFCLRRTWPYTVYTMEGNKWRFKLSEELRLLSIHCGPFGDLDQHSHSPEPLSCSRFTSSDLVNWPITGSLIRSREKRNACCQGHSAFLANSSFQSEGHTVVRRGKSRNGMTRPCQHHLYDFGHGTKMRCLTPGGTSIFTLLAGRRTHLKISREHNQRTTDKKSDQMSQGLLFPVFRAPKNTTEKNCTAQLASFICKLVIYLTYLRLWVSRLRLSPAVFGQFAAQPKSTATPQDDFSVQLKTVKTFCYFPPCELREPYFRIPGRGRSACIRCAGV